MPSRIGVDIGGTFTDIVCYDDGTGAVETLKVPTTPERPELGCIEGLEQLLAGPRLAECTHFIHATTVGLNTLLERKGARVGLLVTRGFRDVLEIRRGLRDDWYRLDWLAPEPLVPRALRLGVGGRVTATGELLSPLAEGDVAEALAVFRREGVAAVAVCLMNAHANPVHEQQVRELLRAQGFGGEISLSHELSGEFRDYERMSTTVVDATVRARLASYLQRLGVYLRGRAYGGAMLIMKSSGGAMHFADAEQRAFETLNSGPAAGVQGAAEMARQCGLGDLVTVDVGGTTTDAALVRDGRPHLVYQGQVAGIPLQTPWVDVRSVGIGGGSIARIDPSGRLRVGPDSAGARPGPACFGRGGTEPTITDAACVLGMLGDRALDLGGRLHRDRAEAALAPLSATAAVPLEELAAGLLKIACASMVNAIRGLTIEQGIATDRLSLFAYGGAGPLFAGQLCQALGTAEAIVPPHAGNFSAWGLLGTEMRQAASANVFTHISVTGLRKVNARIAALLDGLLARLGPRDRAQSIPAVRLDMRYRGQEHALSVEMPLADRQIALSPPEVTARFVEAYERTYFQALDRPVEITALRASIRQALPPRRIIAASPITDEERVSAPAVLEVYSLETGCWMAFRRVTRSSLAPGRRLAGPAIVLEDTTTVYVDAGFSVTADESGCLRLCKD
jgi:N-methylhydantoinase A